MKIFGREPALIVGFISALLSLLVTFNIDGLSGEQAALWTAAITTVFGAITAAITRPIAPAAFTLLITAGADLAAGYHFKVDPATVAALNGLMLAGLTMLTRGQVMPIARIDPNQPSPNPIGIGSHRVE